MEYETAHDLFVHELRGAYHMERRLVDMLDEMAETATNDRISSSFAEHRDETERHVERVEQVFEAMDIEPDARECPVVEALNEERLTVEDAVRDPELLNMFYVNAAMKTERMELTTYDGLLTLADRLELGDRVTDPLQANRDSEDDTLTKLKAMNTASELKSLWEKLTP